MVGIDEVARLAGVSAATVSRALSGNGPVSAEARAKVESTAHDLRYVVSSTASSLASGRTRSIGVVMPRLNRWFFSSVLERAERALLRAGYDLTLYNLGGGDDERRSVFEHFLRRRRVDAVIAVALELTAAEISGVLVLDKPIVGVGGPLRGVTSLAIDEVAVARLATDHLIRLGHTTSLHIGIDDHELAEFFQLTTVAQYPLGQGELAADSLMAQLEPSRSKRSALTVSLPFELIVRSSTARPPER